MPEDSAGSGPTMEEQKESHRLGTINRWEAPDADWPAEYDWTRHRGPPVFPVPGGWTLGIVEADGTSWQYYDDAGVGEHRDTDVDETEPSAYASLSNDPAEDVGLREEPDIEWTLKIDGVQVFRRVEPDREDLYGAAAEALHAYHTGDLEDRLDEFVPASGRKPEDVREQEELEKRREENAGLDEFATDGGRPAESAQATLQAGDLDWREETVAQQAYGVPKERGQTYYYSDGIGGRCKMWVTHSPGVNIPIRVKKVWNPGVFDDDPDTSLEMNIKNEEYAYRLYKALEAYFTDSRSHPWFLLDTEVPDLE